MKISKWIAIVALAWCAAAPAQDTTAQLAVDPSTGVPIRINGEYTGSTSLGGAAGGADPGPTYNVTRTGEGTAATGWVGHRHEVPGIESGLVGPRYR